LQKELHDGIRYFPPSAATDGNDALTLGRLFRAAFRSMAENYSKCAARLSPERDWRRLVFSGGLAQNLGLLRALVVERPGGKVRLSATSEDTLLGLLVLGLVICGRVRNIDEANELVRAANIETT
jgi:hypothetical protein